MNVDQQIASTIKQQIGMWPFAEIGARSFAYGKNSLHFDAKPTTRIVHVVVTLDPSDTYTVKVIKPKSGTVQFEQDGIYNDSLPTVIRNLAKEIAHV